MTDLSEPADPHQREENSGVIHTRRPSKTDRTTFAAKRLLAAIEQLTPEIIARAAEIEAGRCIPRDLVDTLRSLGVFRMFVPESHGGLELDLPSGLAVIKALATIEGSVGWTAMIANGGSLFASFFPHQNSARPFPLKVDVVVAGSIHTSGEPERVGGVCLVDTHS